MDRGLWRYTRHPNYFGDALAHWGLFVIALSTPQGWLTALGPAAMTFLLLRVSGVALLERSIGKRRPEYAAYQRRTSAFLPLPPRA
jgi:steroid 5-alpha reductase family enzyme